MGDVCEGSAVNEGRIVLQRLHQVRHQRVAHEDRHGALGLDVPGRDRFPVARVGDEYPAKPPLQFVYGLAQAEDGHYLRGRRNLERTLAGYPVPRATQADDYLAQGPLVQVQDAPPDDPALVDQYFCMTLSFSMRVDKIGSLLLPERVYSRRKVVPAGGSVGLVVL